MTEREQLERYRRGPRARRDRADQRWQRLHRLIYEEGLPTSGRGAWLRIESRLGIVAPWTLYNCTPPFPLGDIPPKWVFEHTITTRALRRGYRAWCRRTGADCNPHLKRGKKNCG